MKKPLMLLACTLVLGGCATNPGARVIAQPATVIGIKSTGPVIDKLAEICDRSGLQIDTTSTNNIVCSRLSSALAQALFGTKYGTDVRTSFRFNAFKTGKGVRIVANVSMGNQTAFGQNNTTDLGGGGNIGAEAQSMLNQAKQELEKR